MFEHRRVRRCVVPLALVLGVLPGVVEGCSSPTAPPDPPGGGQTLVLDFDQFERTVEPVLVAHGCDATGDCHGGGIRGSLQLSPPGAKDIRFDFDQVVLQVSASDRSQSPILTEPLAIAAGYLLSAQLYGVQFWDPVALAVAAVSLGVPPDRVILQGLGVEPSECTGGDRAA